MVHIYNGIFSSVQFSRSVVSDSFRPHELQHARPPCPVLGGIRNFLRDIYYHLSSRRRMNLKTPRTLIILGRKQQRLCKHLQNRCRAERGGQQGAEHRRIDAFELWCWRRLLRVPWTARRSNQSILKEISPGCSLEGLMLKLKLQYFGHL